MMLCSESLESHIASRLPRSSQLVGSCLEGLLTCSVVAVPTRQVYCRPAGHATRVWHVAWKCLGSRYSYRAGITSSLFWRSRQRG